MRLRNRVRQLAISGLGGCDRELQPANVRPSMRCSASKPTALLAESGKLANQFTAPRAVLGELLPHFG
ncbi:MAG: hypothetical protein J2P48_24885 [Alphaproteobacteria bacterium]|nr:hypothetical protein [Alphaproteobacteria bacterium]